MQVQYTIEIHNGEQSIVGRNRGIICEIYACGDLSRKEISEMKQGLIKERQDVEIMKELGI